MKLEYKKFLAEWMGWSLYNGSTGWVITKEGMSVTHLDIWNPDTNHEQFKDVWNKLGGEQIYKVIEKTGTRQKAMLFANILLNDLPKVMDAVMEVIKENHDN